MRKFITILMFILIGVLSVGLISVALKLDDSIKTRDVKASEYIIGSIGDTGKDVESTGSIVTEDLINVSGLTITVKEDANVTYKLFFYDNEKEFLSCSEELDSDTNSTTVVEGAKYFRIMITPENDSEVSLTEISKYANRLTVTVNK